MLYETVEDFSIETWILIVLVVILPRISGLIDCKVDFLSVLAELGEELEAGEAADSRWRDLTMA